MDERVLLSLSHEQVPKNGTKVRHNDEAKHAYGTGLVRQGLTVTVTAKQHDFVMLEIRQSSRTRV